MLPTRGSTWIDGRKRIDRSGAEVLRATGLLLPVVHGAVHARRHCSTRWGATLLPASGVMLPTEGSTSIDGGKRNHRRRAEDRSVERRAASRGGCAPPGRGHGDARPGAVLRWMRSNHASRVWHGASGRGQCSTRRGDTLLPGRERDASTEGSTSIEGGNPIHRWWPIDRSVGSKGASREGRAGHGRVHREVRRRALFRSTETRDASGTRNRALVH